ncbi:polysaccharide lyase 8 family protein [Propionibacteriaceae bacterium Y1685]
MTNHDHLDQTLTNGGWSRRQVLGATAAVSGVGLWSSFGTAQAADEFAVLRQRWADQLTGKGTDPTEPNAARRLADLSSEAAGLLASAHDEPAAQGNIWDEASMTGGSEANIAEHFIRLVTVATAWATSGSEQFGDDQVGDKLGRWSRHMITHWYNPDINPHGNWWFWEIGIPRQVGDLYVLAHDVQTDEDRAAAAAAVRRFTPDPNYRGRGTMSETGGNRADKALACALRGIIDRRADELVLARDALSDVKGGGKASLFSTVTSGNGFHPDGSYIDHGYLPYVGTYGNVALSGVGRLLTLVADTTWQVTDPNHTRLLDAVERSFAPFIWRGQMLDTVRGRAVSREAQPGATNAFAVAHSALLLATQVPEPYRSRFQVLAKSWLTQGRANPLATASLSELSRALPVLADESISGSEQLFGHYQFGAQERTVHRRPGWAFTVSTSSKRIGRYEWGNNENNLGWYHGDGMAYLLTDTDEDQFAGDFWPTVDPYRMPGTTSSLAERDSGASGAGTGIPRATQAWAGGLRLDDTRGSIGMDHLNHDGTVAARKSWFLLPDAVIAIGSGISTSADDAETTVEQRRLGAGASTLRVDGHAISDPEILANPDWAHIEGVGGYRFLGEHQVRAQVGTRTGSWNKINSGADTAGSTDERSEPYAGIAVLHPKGTTDGRYAYVQLPTMSATETSQLNWRIEILAQTADAHVIRLRTGADMLIMANFFAAADTPTVSADRPCAVAFSTHGRTARVAVSDPSRGADRITITLDAGRVFGAAYDVSPQLSVETGRRLSVRANLVGQMGATATADLRR